jgi:hypothetical protein
MEKRDLERDPGVLLILSITRLETIRVDAEIDKRTG